ncbi:MAG TPA: hypothetical protein VFS15_02995 [Kofleriaceae bacterium]|nr:hypothetical protein [Kofleriaceae bacterium]
MIAASGFTPSARAVGERARVACGDRAALGERGAQLRELLEARVAAHQTVAVDPAAMAGVDLRHLVGQTAARDRGGGTLVRAQRELVLGLARDLPAPGHALGGLAHHLAGRALRDLRPARHEVGDRTELRECGEVVARRGLAERERRERVDELLRQLDLGVARRVAASGDHHVRLAALDRGGRERDRLQARRTRARDGHRLGGGIELEFERDLAADIRRAARQDHAAPHDAFDLAIRQVVACEQRANRGDAERDRVELGEVGERLDERGAHAADDDGPSLG